MLNARGVSQATLQDLGNLCGVTRNALYYYFNDIEDLLFQVYRRSCELLNGHLAAAGRDGATALEAVLGFVDRCLASAAPELAALNEYGVLQPPHYDEVLELYNLAVSSLARVLEGGAQSGELRPLHAPTVARTIISLIHWIPLPGGWIATSRGDRARVVEALKDLLVNGWAARRDRPSEPEPIDLSPLLVRASDGFDQDALALVKRESILNITSRMFTCRGVDSTSLDEIAATLGTTKARVYKYVGDKQTLVAECFLRAERIYAFIMERAQAQGAPRWTG